MFCRSILTARRWARVPNRILRDGILSSEPVSLLGWAEEVFYRRLMSVVDDHGRFHAAPKLIRAACYPLLIDKVSDADIEKWLTKCVTAALVSVYPAQDGKRYIQIIKFGQQVRSKSKFPDAVAEPLLANDFKCEQPIADAHLVVSVFEVVSEVVCVAPVADAPPTPKTTRKKPKTAIPSGFGVSERVTAWAVENGFTSLPQHLDAFRLKVAANGYTYADWDAAFMGAVRDDWAKLRTPIRFGQQPQGVTVLSDAYERNQAQLKTQAEHAAKITDADYADNAARGRELVRVLAQRKTIGGSH